MFRLFNWLYSQIFGLDQGDVAHIVANRYGLGANAVLLAPSGESISDIHASDEAESDGLYGTPEELAEMERLHREYRDPNDPEDDESPEEAGQTDEFTLESGPDDWDSDICPCGHPRWAHYGRHGGEEYCHRTGCDCPMFGESPENYDGYTQVWFTESPGGHNGWE
jgi:hypothetical protein